MIQNDSGGDAAALSQASSLGAGLSRWPRLVVRVSVAHPRHFRFIAGSLLDAGMPRYASMPPRLAIISGSTSHFNMLAPQGLSHVASRTIYLELLGNA